MPGELFKYVDASGRTNIESTPPKVVGTKYEILNAQGFRIANGVVGSLTARPTEADYNAANAAVRKKNAEKNAREDDFHDAIKVLNQKTDALNAAADSLNNARRTLLNDVKLVNKSLKDVNSSQNTIDYLVAATTLVGTAVVLVASAPVVVGVATVVVTGASVVGLLNDLSRPEDDNPTPAKEVEEKLDKIRNLTEAVQANRDAAKVFNESARGLPRSPVGLASRLVGGVGAALSTGLAIRNAQKVANQLRPGIESEAGLDSFKKSLEDFEPTFLQSQSKTFDRDRLKREVDATKAAQQKYQKAKQEYDAAAIAYTKASATLIRAQGR